MKVSALIEKGTKTLSLCPHTDTPALDASLLFEHVTGYDRSLQVFKRDENIPLSQEREFLSLVEKRNEGIPVAYLTGTKGFWDLEFKVTPATLIPRADTETLIESVLSRYKKEPGFTLLDLCTGSGCIGITLARHLEASPTLADISPEALKVAKANCETLIPDLNYTLVETDLFSAIEGRFPLIVTNPPYLKREWIEEAKKPVSYEPDLALDGKGDDGLSLIEKIIEEAPRHLTGGGELIIECDSRQADRVEALLLANRFNSTYIEKDLAGKKRVVRGRLGCMNS